MTKAKTNRGEYFQPRLLTTPDHRSVSCFFCFISILIIVVIHVMFTFSSFFIPITHAFFVVFSKPGCHAFSGDHNEELAYLI